MSGLVKTHAKNVYISYLVPLRLPEKSYFRIQAVVQSTATYCCAEIKYSIHDTVLV